MLFFLFYVSILLLSVHLSILPPGYNMQ